MLRVQRSGKFTVLGLGFGVQRVGFRVQVVGY